MPPVPTSRLLERVADQLGWPSASEITKPKSGGAAMYGRLTDTKIGEALRRKFPHIGIRVGILAAEVTSESTEAPIAIVCEFQNHPPAELLKEAHRQAWNFCHSPLLITIDPQTVRVWNCCEHPQQGPDLIADAAQLDEFPLGESGLSEQATRTLHWINLATGALLRDPRYAERFRRDRRADRLLLDNLRHVRRWLRENGLDADTCHHLLARIIFIQFLFDRKDSKGVSAINADVLEKLQQQKILTARHREFRDLLQNKADSYSLFRYLDRKFNGDLFPGKEEGDKDAEAAWEREERKVKPHHLDELAKLVDGQMTAKNAQLWLWKQYAFDTIPLEFISSIYEEFIKDTEDEKTNPQASKQRTSGAYYTPGHLVDFMLDEVLPWDGGTGWKLRILDPACGSGIFLVKAYQRLLYRWRAAHDWKPVPPLLARQILEECLFGVDTNKDATRVASFSLYLAMLDELDPRAYWRQRKRVFPALRGRTIIHADFFSEDHPGFRTNVKKKYHLVIGNAPWGDKVHIGKEAADWAKKNGWRIADKNLGPLFLPKAATLVNEGDGSVALLQPAQALLFNRSTTAVPFRERLFRDFTVKTIVNFAPLVKTLIPGVKVPACMILLSPGLPAHRCFTYACAKPTTAREDDYRICVEPNDIHRAHASEAMRDSEIWSALMWGGRRGFDLVLNLRNFKTISFLRAEKLLITREGIIRSAPHKVIPALKGRKFFDRNEFDAAELYWLKTETLDEIPEPKIYERDSTDFSAFQAPQLAIKLGWLKASGRFQARVVHTNESEGVLFDSSYFSVHAKKGNERWLDSAWLSINSKLGAAFLMLTSGRFAAERPEPNSSDFCNLPLSEPSDVIRKKVNNWQDADEMIRQTLRITNADWALVEDIFEFTLPDFKGDELSPGRQRTRRAAVRANAQEERQLTTYSEYVVRSLRAGFGQQKAIGATILQEARGQAELPLRVVALHLGMDLHPFPRIESLGEGALRDRIREFADLLDTREGRRGVLYTRRIARIYDEVVIAGRKVPTVYVIKPDQQRYWTRTMALWDAEQIAGDLALAAQQGKMQ